MPERLLRAALLIPNPREAEALLLQCAKLAALHGWHLERVARCWEDLATMLLDRKVDIGIVDSRRRIPPDRLPRVEALDDLRPRPATPQQRRTRRARRLPPDQPR